MAWLPYATFIAGLIIGRLYAHRRTQADLARVLVMASAALSEARQSRQAEAE